MANYQDIFTAVVRADGSQAVRELNRVDQTVGTTVNSAGSKFSQFSTLARGALVGIGSAAVLSLGRTSVQAASDLEESINAVRVTFGEAADDVLKLGQNAAQSLGLSKSEFNGLSVTFSGFAKTIAGPGGDVAAVIDDLTQRAADFGSVLNLDATQAAQVFLSTLAGETEPIRRFGKDISAAAVEQFLLSEGLVKSKKEITEQLKVVGRYQLLMRETADTAGDFANTSDGLANTQRRLNAQLQDAQAKLGELLVPALAAVADGLTDVLDIAERLKILDLAGVFAEWAGPLQLIGKATQYLPGNIKNVSDETLDAFKAAQAAGASYDELRAILDQELNPALHDTVTSWQAYTKWISDADRSTNQAGQSLVDAARQTKALGDAVRAVDSAFLTLSSRRINIEVGALDVGRAVEAYRDLLDGSSALSDRRADALRSVQAAQDRYNDAVRRNADLNKRVQVSDEDRAASLRRIESAQRQVSDAQAKYNALLEGSIELERERRDLALAAREAEFGQKDAAQKVRDLAEGSIELENRRRDAVLAVAQAQDAVRRASERAYSNISISEQLSALVDLQAAQDKLIDAQQAAAALDPLSTELAEERAKAQFDLEKAQQRLESSAVSYADVQAESLTLERRRQDALFGLRSAQASYTQSVRDAEAATRGVTVSEQDRRDALRGVESAQRDLQRAQSDYNALLEGSRVLEEERRRALLNAKQAVIDYANEIGGVPREVTSRILAQLDTGSVVSAINDLQRIASQATARVTLQAQSGGFGTAGVAFNQSLGGALFGGVTLPTSSGVTVVQNFNGVVGDPVAVGRQVASVLNSYRAAGGLVRY